MDITEVRIKLMDEPGERLKAFCSITFDNCFVIRDLKIIEGATGLFVAMPSRKLTAHCPRCGMKNHLRAQYCNQCGNGLPADRLPIDGDGRAKLYADVAHPINTDCREMIQNRVVGEYEREVERAQEPGYVSRYDEYDVEYEPDPQEQPSAKTADRDHLRVDSGHGAQQAPRRTAGDSRQTPASDARPSGGGFGEGIFGE